MSPSSNSRLFGVATLAFALLIAPRDVSFFSIAHAAPPNSGLSEAEITRVNTYLESAAERRGTGDLPGAIHFMRLALQIHQEPAMFYNLARLHELGEDYALALDFYRLALGGTATVEVIAKATEAIARVERLARFGYVMFDLTPNDASVFIDGKPTTLDAEGTVTLPAGEYRLSVEAQGHIAHHGPLTVSRGAKTRIVLGLRQRPEVRPVSPPSEFVTPAPSPPPKDSGGIGAGAWVLISLGGVAVAGGLTCYLVGVDSHRQLDAYKAASASIPGLMWPVSRYGRSSALKASEQGTLLKTIGVSGMGAGVGLVTLGVIVAFASGDEAPTSSFYVLPGAVGDIGLTAGVSF